MQRISDTRLIAPSPLGKGIAAATRRHGAGTSAAALRGQAKKVLFVANTAWYLYNFRRSLASALQKRGVHVVAVCPFDRYVAKLEADGIRCLPWPINRCGMNPAKEILSLWRLARIYFQEQPSLVHHFTIKSILYGTVAARLSGVPAIVNGVTGLGHVFVDDGWVARLLRPVMAKWYGWALTARNTQAMFQNPDDLCLLSKWSPDLTEVAVQTNGSGVDLDRFTPREEANGDRPERTVLFAGRLLAEKGIYEFVEAARICHGDGTDARFVVCGDRDPGNPSSVTEDTVEAWKREGVVQLLGHVDQIEQSLQEADLVVLPSYREGTPRVLLEAAAMAKPIIATDVPGCRQIVAHGYNGILVPPRDAAALATAIQSLLRDESRRLSMGQAGRSLACERFDERHVIDRTLDVYESLWTDRRAMQRAMTPFELERGVFTFSLDLELAWGTRGRPNFRLMPPFLDGTREAIRRLLGLFEQHDVSATWAVVGALLLASGSNGRRHEWLSDPRFGDVPPGDCISQPHWYGEDIIESVRSCRVHQELGCHTLTHLFVDSRPIGRAALAEDLRRFLELFEQRFFDRPSSFIFPKAKMGHFGLLAELGFRCCRGPEEKWFEALPGELSRAAVRLVDAKLGRPPVVATPRWLECGLWLIPSSQFYSPFMGVGKHVSVRARVKKALRGLRLAAERRGVFHLWTHPFNLGVRTDELLEGLDQILSEAARLRDAGTLDILPMGELANRLDNAQTAIAPRLLETRPARADVSLHR